MMETELLVGRGRDAHAGLGDIQRLIGSQRKTQSIRVNDYATILQGALPAAALALLVQGLFEIVERCCVPKGLRIPVAM